MYAKCSYFSISRLLLSEPQQLFERPLESDSCELEPLAKNSREQRASLFSGQVHDWLESHGANHTVVVWQSLGSQFFCLVFEWIGLFSIAFYMLNFITVGSILFFSFFGSGQFYSIMLRYTLTFSVLLWRILFHCIPLYSMMFYSISEFFFRKSWRSWSIFIIKTFMNLT